MDEGPGSDPRPLLLGEKQQEGFTEMTRSLKVLGLVLIAVLAMSGMVAQAASAHVFKSNTPTTTLSGSQNGEHVFTAEGVPLKCTTATFSGTEIGEEFEEVALHPEYGKGGGSCKIGSLTITIVTTGCDYLFHSATPSAEMAPLDVVCSNGNAITLQGTLCKIAIGPQSLSGVSYSNIEGGISVNSTISGIKYISNGLGCAALGIKNGEHANGTIEGLTDVNGGESEIIVE